MKSNYVRKLMTGLTHPITQLELYKEVNMYEEPAGKEKERMEGAIQTVMSSDSPACLLLILKVPGLTRAQQKAFL